MEWIKVVGIDGDELRVLRGYNPWWNKDPNVEASTILANDKLLIIGHEKKNKLF